MGQLRVIRSGVGPRESLTIDGLQRILPGQKVSPRRGRIPAPDQCRAERHTFATAARLGGDARAAMNLSSFFIERPIFASVIALFVTLLGAFAYPALPLAQYPEIAPPSVAVVAAFPGASAETMAETIAAPIEQEVNGVEGMLYMRSNSSQGLTSITITFQPGTDIDTAQVLVQNRVALAEPRLPDQVRQIGVTVTKQATDFLMVAAMTTTDPAIDIDYVGNYANSRVRDRLLRLPGVGAVQVFGGGNYSMRVWIDPDRAAARNLTADEVVAALRGQNVQVAGGSVGQPPFDRGGPAFELPVQVQGRLTDPAQFADIVLKTDPATGAITRLRDVARVELGSQDYGIRGTSNRRQAVFIAIQQLPGSNALEASAAVLADLEAASREFPAGMEYSIPYNPTEYVQASVEEVQSTLIEAIVLVVLVIVIFLQTWRAAIIPIVAIPVSLIGTFAVQLALGFSINTLSLFALVLAVGIVVDDAIVVVEAVEKHIREGLSPRDAAHRTMQEISGALIAIGLVLIAVFVPAALISGIPGIFYRQFAVTIAAAAVISTMVSLTLSPALAALLLKPHSTEEAKEGRRWTRPLRVAGERFNQGFDWLSGRYGGLTAKLVHRSTIMLVIYGGLLGLTVWRLNATPTGFIPDQDQGFLIEVIQLPPGSGLDRTAAAVERIRNVVSQNPMVLETAAFAGLDGSTFSPASNSGIMFIRLAPHEERRGEGEAAAELAGQITGAVAGAEEGAMVFFLSPPPVPGLGNGSGFALMVQDRGGAGYQALQGATFAMMGAAAAESERRPGLLAVQHRQPPDRGRGRPRPRAIARRAADPGLSGARNLSRLELRQRFQPARPHLPGDRAGRGERSRRSLRRRPPSGALRQRRDGAALGPCDLPLRQRPGPGRALQQLSGRRAAGPDPARNLVRRVAAHDGADRGAGAPARLRLRMDRPRLSAAAGRKHRPDHLRDRGAVRVHGARRAI